MIYHIEIRMQDLILKTSNMYDSAQTNIVNILAGKERREGWADLFMHMERGKETVIDENLHRDPLYNLHIKYSLYNQL